jgi:two-component system chemotaxis response regulator CheY
MSKTVVVVDDSASIREVVSFTIESEGFNVLKGSDGADALKHFDGQEINLVITDLHMPNIDGIGLITRIRNIEAYKHIPILLLTTETSQEKKGDAKQAGATGWLVKPFEPEKLIKIINKVMR